MNDSAFMTQRELTQRYIDNEVHEGAVEQETRDILTYFGDLSELLADYAPELSPLVMRFVDNRHATNGPEFTGGSVMLAEKIYQLARARAERRVTAREGTKGD